MVSVASLRLRLVEINGQHNVLRRRDVVQAGNTGRLMARPARCSANFVLGT